MRSRKISVFLAAAMVMGSFHVTSLAAEPMEDTGCIMQEKNRTEIRGKGSVQARGDWQATDEVTEIEILQLPDKTTYYGSHIDADYMSLSLEGMKLRLTYEYGETVDVHYMNGDWYDDSGNWYEISAVYTGDCRESEEGWSGEFCEVGEQTAELSAGEAAVEFSIDIVGITRVSLKQSPACTQYWGEFEDVEFLGSVINSDTPLDGMQLDVRFSDGSAGVMECRDSEWRIDGEPVDGVATWMSMRDGEMAVGVDGRSCSFPVTQKNIKSISISKLPDQTLYFGEESFLDVRGIGIKAFFTDGTSDVLYFQGYDELWENAKGESVWPAVEYSYGGAYQDDGEHFAYGAWPVEVRVDQKTATYQIQVLKYQRKNMGILTPDCKHEISGAGPCIYEYTFTPKETGRYQFEKAANSCISMIYAYLGNEQAGVVQEKFGNTIWMYSGKEYKIEINLCAGNGVNYRESFTMKKKMTVREEEITVGKQQEIRFAGDDTSRIYRFTPKTSGVYTFYMERVTEDAWAHAEIGDGERERFWTGCAGWSAGRYYNESIYLTAGETYTYNVSTGYGEQGTLRVGIRQEEDMCSHEWEKDVEEESSCGAPGMISECCYECGIYKYKTIPRNPHKFGAETIVKNATIFEEGVKGRVCAECGQLENKRIPKAPSYLNLNTASIVLKVKQSTTAVKITEMAGGDEVASWTSSNPKIVKVTNRGKITAGKKTGKAVITVTLKSGKTAKVTVKVQKKKVKTKKLKVPKKKITLKKGRSYRIVPILNPITTQDKVKYSTSKKKIAIVSKKGVIKAKKPGTAKVKVVSGKKKAVITVKVVK